MILSYYGQPFIEAFDAMLILILGQITILFGGSVGYLLAMTGYQALASKVVVMASVLNLILNLMLIPHYGMIGAAAATCIALGFRSGVLGYLVWKRLGIMPTAVAPLLLRLINNRNR